MYKSFRTLTAAGLLISLFGCSLFSRHDQAKNEKAAEEVKSKKEDDFKIVLNSKPVATDKSTPNMTTAPEAEPGPGPDRGPAPGTNSSSENSSSAQPSTLKWSYSGETGPDHWGDLDPAFAMCKNGELQSPIDLIYKKPKKKKEVLLDYRPSLTRLTKSELTLRVEFSKSNAMMIDGKSFELKEAIFHTPSEHNLSGKSFDGEIQLFHKLPTGEIGIAAVFLKKGGKTNSALATLLSKVPQNFNETVEVLDTMVDPAQFLPKSRTFYQYVGSLSFPPCAEGVTWVVFNTPISISDEQFEKIKGYADQNARPVQVKKAHQVFNY